MSNPTVSIIIGNRLIVDSFQELSIYLSMEGIANAMSFTTTDFYPDAVIRWRVKLGDLYIIKVGREILSTGYIDEIEIDQDEGEYNITFSGRDKTADLVDCHYTEKGTWGTLSIFQIVTKLCSPFKILVKFDKSVASEVNKPLKLPFIADVATPVVDLIMKACSNTGILPMSKGDGFLTLTRANLTNIYIDIIDSTIISRNIVYSDRDRFSEYTAKGQSVANDTIVRLPGYTAIENPKVKDSHFRRDRPYVLMVDDNASTSFCRKKAIFERNARAGNSRKIEYTLQGITAPLTGRVWKPNSLVSIDEPVLFKKGLMLISEVELSMTADAGYETTLKLVDKRTYSVSPVMKTFSGFE